jgi:hypothetical protein
MPTITRIATIQRSLRELGRIRLGDQVEFSPGKRRPRKLATFRLTSASRSYITAAAEAYGGTVSEWASPRGTEYEVTIESLTLDVLVPPGDAVSQAFEMWTAAGCIRRCDGELQEATDDQGRRLPCACPEDPNVRQELAGRNTPEACKPTTRLWVILPRLPDLGRWRLESHGYYAAVELAGMAEIASMATSQGIMLPARLRIDQRRRKIPGKPTREYIVPVLELPDTNFGQLVAGGFIQTTAPAIGAGDVPALGPGSAPRAALGPGKPARAERPALGTAPEVPSGNGFGRPDPIAAATVAAPIVGGWPVEEAPPPQEVPGEAAATPAEALAKTPQEATADVAVKRSARRAARVETEVPAGLSMEAFASLAHQASTSSLKLANAIDCVPSDVGKRVEAMSDEERGRLADELKLAWRTA